MLVSKSNLSNASSLVEAGTLWGHINIVFFVSEKKKKSCFIFKRSSTLGGPLLETVDFKSYVVLFLLFGLCFLYLESKEE